MSRLVDTFGLSAPGATFFPFSLGGDVACGAGSDTIVFLSGTLNLADAGSYSLVAAGVLTVANGGTPPSGVTLKLVNTVLGGLLTQATPTGPIGGASGSWFLPFSLAVPLTSTKSPFGGSNLQLVLNPTAQAVTVKANSSGWLGVWRNADA